jgi:hypothetical protein
MCENLVRTYSGEPCRSQQHTHVYSIQRCTTSQGRPDRAYCVGPDGTTRSLQARIDVQDRNWPGKCPKCQLPSPPSSVGSDDIIV